MANLLEPFPHSTLPEVFEAAISQFGHRQRFFTKNDDRYFTGVPFPEVYRRGKDLGLALMELGLEPRRPVAVFADNRVEWIYADIAVLTNGAFNVPRGTDSMPAELEYILSHSEAEICIVENKKVYKRLKDIFPKTKVKHVIVMDPKFDLPDENVLRIGDLIKKGETLRDKYDAALKERTSQIQPNDLFTLIYTSGTTGQPKGVMLCHRNMMYQLQVMPHMLGLEAGDRILSILPVWHIFERVLEYQLIHAGANMFYSTPKDMREDFIRVKPTFMGSAPRLWEQIYYRLRERVDESESFNRWLFQTAFEVKKNLHKSLNYLRGNESRIKPEAPMDRVVHSAQAVATAAGTFLADRYLDPVALSRVRAIVGGELKGTISGGGALPAHIDEFFNAIGIPVYEGYGMTETSPIISVRRKGRVVQGTVGQVTPGNEVRILDDSGRKLSMGQLGVVHVKGPGVMLGYYKNPEATQKVLSEDGWLNTGDIGYLDLDGNLVLKGRAKDTIVLFGGENVEPVPIENELLDDKLVEQVMVVGQDRKTLGALIWPDFDQLRDAGYDVHETDNLNEHEEIVDLFSKMIKRRVSSAAGFKDFEKVTAFRFIPRKFQTDDELTKLGKMKRNRIADKYDDLIDAMYGR